MKLYTGPLSLFSAKIRIAIDEKGLAPEHISVGWSLADRYLPHHPEVLAANPRGQVPVLVDEGLALYDSTVIFEYLEDRYPEPSLYPADPVARARCRLLESKGDEEVFPPLWDLIEEAFYPASDEGRDEARLAIARKQLHDVYAQLEREIAGRTWLCDTYSVADIGCFVMISAAGTLGCPPDADRCPELSAWMARNLAREASSREVTTMQAFVASLFAQPEAATA